MDQLQGMHGIGDDPHHFTVGSPKAVATIAAVIDPTEAPAMMSGRRSTSLKALSTPIW